MSVFLFLCCMVPVISMAGDMVTQRVSGYPVRFDKSLIRAVDPAITRAVAAYNADPQSVIIDNDYPFDIKLTAQDADYLAFSCNGGPSGDPHCSLADPRCHWWDNSSDTDHYCESSVDFPGKTFIIPGDGCIYSGGHTNNLFDEKRKFCRGPDGVIKEVKQPYLVSGLKSKALRDLTLYDDKSLTRPVAKIAKGDPVEVILASDKTHDNFDRKKANRPERYQYFLLRDRYGIAGWAALSAGSQQSAEIDGIYYYGD